MHNKGQGHWSTLDVVNTTCAHSWVPSFLNLNNMQKSDNQ